MRFCGPPRVARLVRDTAEGLRHPMSLLGFFQWLERTPGSIAIRESTLAFPFIEGTHVIALALSVGTLVVLDLRLMGWGMRETPVSRIFEQLRSAIILCGRWTAYS